MLLYRQSSPNGRPKLAIIYIIHRTSAAMPTIYTLCKEIKLTFIWMNKVSRCITRRIYSNLTINVLRVLPNRRNSKMAQSHRAIHPNYTNSLTLTARAYWHMFVTSVRAWRHCILIAVSIERCIGDLLLPTFIWKTVLVYVLYSIVL